jgi:hypothetical protein
MQASPRIQSIQARREVELTDESVTCASGRSQIEAKVSSRLLILFGIRGFDLQDEPVDFFGAKLAAVPGHAALAIINDVS